MSTPSSAIQTQETTDIEVFAHEWTPESLQANIEREKKLRSIVITYYQGEMNQGHHYYNLPGQEGRKPALSKEGSLNLCSLFKVTPCPDEAKEIFHPDGHYTVRYRVHLVSNRGGAIVATGDGLCSTRESKYAHRWAWGSEVPDHVDKTNLEKREWTKNNRDYVKYKLPNEDIADQYNTVLKMALKRAIVDAALKLPLVSELFTQDLEEQITENVNAKAQTTQSRTNNTQPPRPQTNSTSKKETMLKLKDKLIKEHEQDETDLVMTCLPEGVAKFEDVTEEQAKEIVPKLSGLLNAILNNEREKSWKTR